MFSTFKFPGLGIIIIHSWLYTRPPRQCSKVIVCLLLIGAFSFLGLKGSFVPVLNSIYREGHLSDYRRVSLHIVIILLPENHLPGPIFY